MRKFITVEIGHKDVVSMIRGIDVDKEDQEFINYIKRFQFFEYVSKDNYYWIPSNSDIWNNFDVEQLYKKYIDICMFKYLS